MFVNYYGGIYVASKIDRIRVAAVGNMGKVCWTRSGAIGIGLALVIFYMSFNVGPEFLAPQIRASLQEYYRNSTGSPTNVDVDDPALQVLIDGLRDATKRVKSLPALSDDHHPNLRRWRSQHPCESRGELQPLYDGRKFVAGYQPGAGWTKVLEEYEALHRKCIQSVGDSLNDYFLSGNTSTGCQFLVADALDFGLGNRLLTVASASLYAILTHRILLVPTSTRLPDLMCEPFVGSSWRVESEGVFTPADSHPQLWTSTNTLLHKIDLTQTIAGGDEFGNSSGGSEEFVSNSTYASRGEDGAWHPVDRFFCDTEQAYVKSKVTWVYLTGCHYFLPNLFTVPSFRPALERLFPDHKMALTTVMRSLMLPSDPVWRQVKEANDVHFNQRVNTDEFSHRIGIQVRYVGGKDQYEKFNEFVNTRIVNCLIENAILQLPPNSSHNNNNVTLTTSSTSEVKYNVAEAADGHSRRQSTVFIASLHDGLLKHLKSMYNSSTSAGSDDDDDDDGHPRHLLESTSVANSVRVVQLTHGEEQKSGLDEDQGALAEILLLSFSDDLFVTPSSTFGGIAQVYGGLIPWFIDYDPSSNNSCFHGQTVDICFSRSLEMFTCPYDTHSFTGKRLADVMPYIKECPAIETPHPPGFQIVN